MRGKTWKVQILAGTLALAGIVGEASAQAPAGPAGQGAAAMVNGQPISMADFQAVMAQVQTPVELPLDRKKMLQLQALGIMIDEMLMKQYLAQHAPPVAPAEVDKQFAELLEAIRKEGKSLDQFCKEGATTPEAIRKDLAVHVQWTNYTRAQISDAQLQRYYQENKDFFDGVTVRASHVLLRVPQGTPEAEKAKVRTQLTEIRNQILARQIDFASAAKKWSMCPITTSRGGDCGDIPQGP